MPYSRRDLTLFLAAAAGAMAQTPGLASKTYRFEDLPVRGSGPSRTRKVLRGKTRKDFTIQVHQTELAPGNVPHASHSHAHEEMLFIREGTLEVTIAGQNSTLGPGSVAYVASNEHHGWRNVGPSTAHYFVLALDPA